MKPNTQNMLFLIFIAAVATYVCVRFNIQAYAGAADTVKNMRIACIAAVVDGLAIGGTFTMLLIKLFGQGNPRLQAGEELAAYPFLKITRFQPKLPYDCSIARNGDLRAATCGSQGLPSTSLTEVRLL